MLEELDVKGRSIWRGPIETQTVGGPPPNQTQGAQLAGLGASDAPSRRVQKWAKPAKFTAGIAASPFALASQVAIKISVNHEAWYRVTQQELLSAGLDPQTDPRNLQLYVDWTSTGQTLPRSQWDINQEMYRRRRAGGQGSHD